MLGRIVNAICFWLLAMLACGLFFIAVILPPYREHERYRQVEEDMKSSVARLERRAESNAQKLDALRRGDPLMQDNLRREIFHDQTTPGQVINVAPVGPIAIEPRSEPPSGRDEEEDWQSLTRRLRDVASREEFSKLENEKVQRLQLLLSALAISMAMIFFGTPTKRPEKANG